MQSAKSWVLKSGHFLQCECSFAGHRSAAGSWQGTSLLDACLLHAFPSLQLALSVALQSKVKEDAQKAKDAAFALHTQAQSAFEMNGYLCMQ